MVMENRMTAIVSLFAQLQLFDMRPAWEMAGPDEDQQVQNLLFEGALATAMDSEGGHAPAMGASSMGRRRPRWSANARAWSIGRGKLEFIMALVNFEKF
jgi:hypothetical protein